MTWTFPALFASLCILIDALAPWDATKITRRPPLVRPTLRGVIHRYLLLRSVNSPGDASKLAQALDLMSRRFLRALTARPFVGSDFLCDAKISA
jgi:hypothetical protein